MDMSYSQTVTRKHRTLFVIAVDQSGSMLGLPKGKSCDISRANIAAMTASMFIDELIYKSTNMGEVRDYYDVAVLGYSAGDVRPLLDDNQQVLPISVIAGKRDGLEQIIYDTDGSLSAPKLFRTYVAEWVKPTAFGDTSIVEMLYTVNDIVSKWCSNPNNRDSFPPIVVNITDDTRALNHSMVKELYSRLSSLGTSDGKVIVLSIYIDESGNDKASVHSSDAQRVNNLPSILMDAISKIGQTIEESGDEMLLNLSYDTTLMDIMQFVNIGSYSRVSLGLPEKATVNAY